MGQDIGGPPPKWLFNPAPPDKIALVNDFDLFAFTKIKKVRDGQYPDIGRVVPLERQRR